jgi:hypothetical protein
MVTNIAWIFIMSNVAVFLVVLVLTRGKIAGFGKDILFILLLLLTTCAGLLIIDSAVSSFIAFALSAAPLSIPFGFLFLKAGLGIKNLIDKIQRK